MEVRFWQKVETQRTLRDLRHAGFIVEKVPGGYKAYDTDPKELVLSALMARYGYLVRYEERLFQPA
jgi:hypothetical protein